MGYLWMEKRDEVWRVKEVKEGDCGRCGGVSKSCERTDVDVTSVTGSSGEKDPLHLPTEGRWEQPWEQQSELPMNNANASTRAFFGSNDAHLPSLVSLDLLR